MKPEEKNEQNKDNNVGGAQLTPPDPEMQNDTYYAGTTNATSENRQTREGYKIAIEDTLIGYDGNEEQMDMDLDEEERRRFGKIGVGDNN
jgi:hypothetical protein